MNTDELIAEIMAMVSEEATDPVIPDQTPEADLEAEDGDC